MKYFYWKDVFFSSLLYLVFVFSSGCATHGSSMKPVLYAMSNADYATAIKFIENNLGNKKNERLVYNMEMGLLKHLEGNFIESNRNLERAVRISEKLETKRVGNLFKTALTNPRSAPYRGTKYEKIFIHYYKALNFLKLAVTEPSKKIKYIESARIEARQIDIKLTAIEKEVGNYQEANDKKKSFFGKLIKIFNTLEGNIDKDKLVYREDAYIRYLTGVVYEKNGELDNARISYQKAAELYEKGFAEQYNLGTDMTEIAWFDTIRIMIKSGGWEKELPELIDKKLSSIMAKKLDEYTNEKGQLIIIQGIGIVPSRDELNLKMTIDVPGRALVLSPVLRGDSEERRDQSTWFASMYAETGLISIVSNYMSRGAAGAIEGVFSKRFSLSPFWPLVEAAGLPETMQVLGGLGVRVTVPYYRPSKANFFDTMVWVDNQKIGKLADAESIAHLAIQEQLLNSASDLKEAVVREVIKNSITSKAGGYFALAGALVNAATSAAETRNWLSLPYIIRVKRLALSPGKHKVRLLSYSTAPGAIYADITNEVEIKKGEISLLNYRGAKFGSLKK